jgi:hypothetical protein
MSNKYARELSERITNEQIFTMLKRAILNVEDWAAPSKSNKGISRGSHWNIFCQNFDVEKKINPMVKYRMLQEYSEFLPLELKQQKKESIVLNPPSHQEPNFEKWN